MAQTAIATSEFAACPECNAQNAKKVGFTWWGGMVGPRMLNHVKCSDCGATYNGKTGQSNTTSIVIYAVVVFALGIAVLSMR